MSDGLIGGRTWANFKQTLEGPPAGDPRSNMLKDGDHIPLHERLKREFPPRHEESDPFSQKPEE